MATITRQPADNAPDAVDEYEVDGLMPPGWPQLILMQKKTGWRAYWRHAIHTYNGGNFGQGSHLHYRHRAVLSNENGKPLGSFRSPEDARDTLVDTYMQWGFMPE